MSRINSSHSSNNATLVKPNCTIRKRHDEILDDLADERFASRSEALRVAIEKLEETVTEDGDTVLEQLTAQISDLSAKIDQLNEQMDEFENPISNPSSENISDNKQSDPMAGVDVSTSQGRKIGSLENEVYALLLNQGPMTESNIANEIDGGELDTRNALETLVDRTFINKTQLDEGIKYKINRNSPGNE